MSLKIDFLPDMSLYHDYERGSNWFAYFYQIPIPLEYTGWRDIVSMSISYYAETEKTRQENARIVAKYLKLVPFYTVKIDEFVETHFQGFVVGVHYRRTDKTIEAPTLEYDQVVHFVDAYVQKEAVTNFMLYVATDMEPFLTFMKLVYTSRVCTYDAVRSKNGDPVHFSTADAFTKGEDVLMESYILSRTSVLFRTSSNVSLFSTFLNLDLPVIEMTSRYT